MSGPINPTGRVLLIAGCGDLGSGLGLAWTQAGGQAWGLRRQAERVPAPIVPIRADLLDLASLRALPARPDAIVYIATPERYDALHYREAYVDGLANLLQAIPQAGRGDCRLLFVSSTSVYGEDGGERVDEDTPARPTGFAGRHLLAAEQLLDGRENTVVVRFGGIYGPGRTRLIERARKAAATDAKPVLWTNRIHRDDCVGVLLHLLTLPAPERLYLGVDTRPVPLHTVLDWLAAAQGLPARPRPPAAGQERGKRCSSQRLSDSGYRFLHPDFVSGYGALLATQAGDQRREGV
jgi:nucleoside-diphosphate-sugar epimerase